MAKAAFSIAGDRIAPVFDVARPLRIIDAEGGFVVGESDAEFADDVPERRALQLVALGVAELVCGAASRPMHAALAAHGIRVTPFVTGRMRDVVQAWLSGHLTRPAFAMPGCRGRRRRGGLAGCDPRGGEMPFGGFGRGERSAGGGGGRGQGRGGRRDGERGGGRGQGTGQGRGPRLGRMGGPLAAGAFGTCVCPACGHREPHERGVPCVQTQCPTCGTAMTRGVGDE